MMKTKMTPAAPLIATIPPDSIEAMHTTKNQRASSALQLRAASAPLTIRVVEGTQGPRAKLSLSETGPITAVTLSRTNNRPLVTIGRVSLMTIRTAVTDTQTCQQMRTHNNITT